MVLTSSSLEGDEDDFSGGHGAPPASGVPYTVSAAALPAYAHELNGYIDSLVRAMNASQVFGQGAIISFLSQLGTLMWERDDIDGGPEEEARLGAALEKELTSMYSDPHQRDLTTDRVRDILRGQEIPGLVVVD